MGVDITIIEEGTGPAAAKGNTVNVHYVGTLENGTKFDSSRDRNKPFSFTLGRGQVIRGWDEGFQGMKVGTKARPNGIRGVIPGNATLIFDVELLSIQ
jgi:peptidylprolyl isomerase